MRFEISHVMQITTVLTHFFAYPPKQNELKCVRNVVQRRVAPRWNRQYVYFWLLRIARAKSESLTSLKNFAGGSRKPGIFDSSPDF